MSSVALYFIIAVALKFAFILNILPPCLWKTLFHTECPGCGLTGAFMAIISFDMPSAYEANPLIFIVLPLGLFFIGKDFMKFKREQASAGRGVKTED